MLRNGSSSKKQGPALVLLRAEGQGQLEKVLAGMLPAEGWVPAQDGLRSEQVCEVMSNYNSSQAPTWGNHVLFLDAPTWHFTEPTLHVSSLK